MGHPRVVTMKSEMIDFLKYVLALDFTEVLIRREKLGKLDKEMIA